MKHISKSILTAILCALIAITVIGADTAWAAEKTPLKVTFKKKTVTLMKDINEGLKESKFPTVKALQKKWGKPEKKVDETGSYTDYIWEKDGSYICYTIPKKHEVSKQFVFITEDKNLEMFGLKVGMKQAKAQKLLEDLGGETNEYSTALALPYDWEYFSFIQCAYKNGKVARIDCHIHPCK
ncbi:hypothetical protein AALB53_20900 [Lachnospiraceae bacterium 47-T17]